MEESNQNQKLTGIQSASSRTSFHLVTDQEPGQPSQIRRHVARERWKVRKASDLARIQRTKPRTLASASTLPSSSASPSNPDSASGLSSKSKCQEVLINPPYSRQKGSRKCVASRIPNASSCSPSPYKSLGYAEFDPFNVIHLSRNDQSLLHHWTNVYAFKAFGQPKDPTLHPLSDVYVPIDLSDQASTHATLAHSASHLAYLDGKLSSVLALFHKSAAIKLINESLNDPKAAVSDGVLAAVLRLLTFEGFWGTEDAMRLHQNGLCQLVRQWGGLETLSSNWRLEMRILLAPLLSKRLLPSRDSSPTSKFINIFNEISIPGPEISAIHPAIGRAAEYLKSLAKVTPLGCPDKPLSEQEIERLMCIIYLSFACTQSQHSHFNLNFLNGFLESPEHVWCNSTSKLRLLLIQCVGKGPVGLTDAQRTGRIDEIARTLTQPSYISPGN